MLDYAAATRLHRQLRELPELLAYAQLATLPGSRPRSAHVTGATRTAPTPLRLDVASWLGPAAPGAVHDHHGDQDGLTPVIGTLAAWARIAEEEHPCHGQAHTCRPDETTIGSLLTYLAARDTLAWTVLQPWADEYAAEIGDIHRRCTPLALLRPRRRAMHLPCPRCQLLTLVTEDGHDTECINPECRGVILRADEYDRRVEEYLDELAAA